jgi:hypothetical protein
MAKRYIMYRIPVKVDGRIRNLKKATEQDLSKWVGKNMKLTMPKFLNALTLKTEEINRIIPFNKVHLLKLSKLKKGRYDL